MARHIGPKNKLARKIGEDLGLKSNAVKVAKRIAVRPGQHGHKGRRKLSDYGVQLKEKQKLKYIFGITEKQLEHLYTMASKNPTATGTALLSLLERRLDNMVYRAGWAPTRASARQLVNHGHVEVNGKKLGIPSYQVLVNDVVTLKTSASHIPVVAQLIAEGSAAGWMDRKGPSAKVVRLPERKDVTEVIDEQMVVEFYSRV